MELPKCKRMTDSFITNAKSSLSNLTRCAEVVDSTDPLKSFSEGIQNFYNHYTGDHSSVWCKFHGKVCIYIRSLKQHQQVVILSDIFLLQEDDNGKPYTCKHTFTCPSQLQEFKIILQDMADRPHEYVSKDGKFTNNVPEGYHGIALAYRDKRIDLGAEHYSCKTNMSVLHKVHHN